MSSKRAPGCNVFRLIDLVLVLSCDESATRPNQHDASRKRVIGRLESLRRLADMTSDRRDYR